MFGLLRKWTCGCLILCMLLIGVIVGLLFLLLAKPGKAAPLIDDHPPAYDIILVSDQSLSMWECNGVGSDPDLLRVEAVHLFVNYLGADSGSAPYRLGLLHFGAITQQMAPLTDVSRADTRQQLATVANAPEPIAWTNPLLALETAQQILNTTARSGSRRVVVLLTDGEPAWPADQVVNEDEYRQGLRQIVRDMAAAQTDLFFVQLTNPSTTCDQAAIANWMALWEELVELTPNGALYTAAQASDLLPIYHAIVRDLTGALESTALAEQQAVPANEPLLIKVPVVAELASMTLVILKEDPATTVTLFGPGGAPPDANASTVTVTGNLSRQEIWRIERPKLGEWQVSLSGRGEVTVWQDRIPLPTPTPTATPWPTATPSPTATSTPTLLPTPTATATPTVTPTHTATPIPTATWTATVLPTATAVPKAIPSPTATATPAPTATATPPPVAVITQAVAPAPRLNWRSWLTGLLVAASIGGGALMWRRKTGRILTGQLVMISGPDGALLPLPYDLGRHQRRRFYLGRRGQGEWRLNEGVNSLCLSVNAGGDVLLTPLQQGNGHANSDTKLTLNGTTLHQATALQDGDLIGCGAYLVRYENLLL